jgi:L-amino acid N-acyltransferase YncA
MMNYAIDSMQPEDWSSVCLIYEEGIATRNATFETHAPDWYTWDKSHVEDCRLVARMDGDIVGWAALSKVSGRCVYAGVAEVSVYIAVVARSKGVGKALLGELVRQSEQSGFWTLQAGILRENTASISLHKACGFREVGYRERLGELDGVWRDVVLMERRSTIVGL